MCLWDMICFGYMHIKHDWQTFKRPCAETLEANTKDKFYLTPIYILLYNYCIVWKILYSRLESWEIQTKVEWIHWYAEVCVSVTSVCNRSCLEIWTFSSFSSATLTYSPESDVLLLGLTFLFDEQISFCTGDHHSSWLVLQTQTVASYIFIDLFCHFWNQVYFPLAAWWQFFYLMKFIIFFFLLFLVKNGKTSYLTLVLSRMCKHYYGFTFAATFITVSTCGYLKGRTS